MTTAHHHPGATLDQPPNLDHLKEGHGLPWLTEHPRSSKLWQVDLHRKLHRHPGPDTLLTLPEAAALRRVLGGMPYGAAAKFRLTSHSVADPMSLGRHDALVTVADVIADLTRLRLVLAAVVKADHQRDLQLDEHRAFARALRQLLVDHERELPHIPHDPASVEEAEEGARTA